MKKSLLLLMNVCYKSKRKDGSHCGFCGYMQQHSGLWKISILTFLVVNVVKTKVITGAGQGGLLSSGITR